MKVEAENLGWCYLGKRCPVAGLFLQLPDYVIYYKITSLLSPAQFAKAKSECAELLVS